MTEKGSSTGRRADMAVLVIAAGLAGMAALIAWSTYSMGGAASYSRLGPTAFPYAIAGGLFILAVWTVFAALRNDFPAREPQKFGPVVWIVGGLVAQMLLLDVAGFSIATGLLFAATARGFGRGPLWMTIPLGIVISLVVWFIFTKGLNLTLPAGPLERLI